MLDKLRGQYGDMLLQGNSDFYAFPTLDQLTLVPEDELRSLGFGYRAKFIVQSALLLKELGGQDYLHNLRAHPDPCHVQAELMRFAGVGRKVADCVALFSLDKLEAIPVDTHVWQIACRDFHAKVVKLSPLSQDNAVQVGDFEKPYAHIVCPSG
jgi:N-glycosylase/DNA lyase